MTGCCSVKHFENIITGGVRTASCPCCPEPDKTTLHVLLCENETRRKLYFESIVKFEAQLRKKKTDPEIVSLLVQYPEGHGATEFPKIACFGNLPQNKIDWVFRISMKDE